MLPFSWHLSWSRNVLLSPMGVRPSPGHPCHCAASVLQGAITPCCCTGTSEVLEHWRCPQAQTPSLVFTEVPGTSPVSSGWLEEEPRAQHMGHIHGDAHPLVKPRSLLASIPACPSRCRIAVWSRGQTWGLAVTTARTQGSVHAADSLAQPCSGAEPQHQGTTASEHLLPQHNKGTPAFWFIMYCVLGAPWEAAGMNLTRTCF